MPSLAQRLMDEGKEKWEKQGIEKGVKKNAREMAKRMLNDDLPIESIIKYTGLTEKEVKELMS